MGPIGVFDSGYGGLTVLREFRKFLPEHDFVYLGDSARTPYGTRSFESVYDFTLEGVSYLLEAGCPLVILACNTASAKALRTIQQIDLPKIGMDRRVLGVIRPTTEEVGNLTRSGHVGILATEGTVRSGSYTIEINKFFPDVKVYQQACPMFVPLIENNAYDTPGGRYFIDTYINELMSQASDDIDTIILGCTHYPLLVALLKERLSSEVRLVSQGTLVAPKLVNYLERHPEIATQLTRQGSLRFLTTDKAERFDVLGEQFFGEPLNSELIHL